MYAVTARRWRLLAQRANRWGERPVGRV